jgi:hypothetical protein
MELRASNPDEGEHVGGLHDRHCVSLHSGRYRAVTWYDAQTDIVWLLAAGKHIADSDEDLYNVASSLERAQRLYPTDEDYVEAAAAAQVEIWRVEAKELRRLRDQAIEAQDGKVRQYSSDHGLYAELWVEVLEDLAGISVRIRMRRESGPWIDFGGTELDILLAGPLSRNYKEVGDEDWQFRRYEDVIPLPVENQTTRPKP